MPEEHDIARIAEDLLTERGVGGSELRRFVTRAYGRVIADLIRWREDDTTVRFETIEVLERGGHLQRDFFIALWRERIADWGRVRDAAASGGIELPESPPEEPRAPKPPSPPISLVIEVPSVRPEDLPSILAMLRGFSADASIRIVDALPGSVILVLDGPQASLARLVSAGPASLSALLGVPVSAVQWGVPFMPRLRRALRRLRGSRAVLIGLAFLSLGGGAVANALLRNHTPVADAGGPYTAGRRTDGSVAPVRLDASHSVDLDARDQGSLTYLWTFPDNATATGVAPEFHASHKGILTVRLVVVDPRGARDDAEAEVRVANAPPVAGMSTSDCRPSPGEVLVFDARTSLDPDQDALTYAWTVSSSDAVLRAGADESVAHIQFLRAGPTRVTLRVSDGEEPSTVDLMCEVGNATPSRPVNEPPTSLAGGPYTAQKVDLSDGGDVPTFRWRASLDASSSTDPDRDPLTFRWTFPDGQTATGAKVTHDFAHTAETVDVSLEVDDGHGHVSRSATTVLMGNHPPRPQILRPTAPCSFPPGTGFPVASGGPAGAGGGGPDPDDDPLTYAWTLDGGPAVLRAAKGTLSLPTEGRHTITLEATDSLGARGTSTLNCTARTPKSGETATDGEAGKAAASGTVDAGKTQSTTPSTHGGGGAPSTAGDQTSGERVEAGPPDTIGNTDAPGIDPEALTSRDPRGAIKASGTAGKVAGVAVTRPDPPNHAPTAVVGKAFARAVTLTLPKGETIRTWRVALDASSSKDPDGDELSFAWTFPDASQKSGEKVEYEAAQHLASFDVGLTVSDGHGKDAQLNVTVTVANEAPVARLKAPSDPCVGHIGEAMAFDASGSSDADHDAMQLGWNIDGKPLKTEANTVQTRFPSIGEHRITLSVTDALGAHDTLEVRCDIRPGAAAPGPR